VLFARGVARELGVDVPVGKQGIREFLAIKVPPGLDPLYRGWAPNDETFVPGDEIAPEFAAWKVASDEALLSFEKENLSRCSGVRSSLLNCRRWIRAGS